MRVFFYMGCNREGKQEKGGREPKGRKDPRTGGHWAARGYDYKKKEEIARFEDTKRETLNSCAVIHVSHRVKHYF
jgi:hypothetical protein